MKILLLDREDELSGRIVSGYDLIIDLGRAPQNVYRRLEQQTGCKINSLHDLSRGIGDLYRVGELLQSGKGLLIDRYGIDWWDVLSIEALSDLLLVILANRQASLLPSKCELFASRRNMMAVLIADQVGTKLHTVRGPLLSQRLRRYYQVFATLDAGQIAQGIEDRLIQHRIWRSPDRGRFEHLNSVILLPSAYVNGSRMAVELAKGMPDQQFLLIYTRSNAKLPSLPGNVSIARLATRNSQDDSEAAALVASWKKIKSKIAVAAEELALANSVGVLDKIESMLPSAILYRNAWSIVFNSVDVAGCFCTDDSNFSTRIPLILARNRGLCTTVSHHGALDYFMAVKTRYADTYLAKTELERDYLERICQMPAHQVSDWYQKRRSTKPPTTELRKPWLVFFSELYSDRYWRTDEVYAELLPALSLLAAKLQLQLILKIHPLESIKEHRRRLRLFLRNDANNIQIISGAPDEHLWSRAAVALTVQSTTALECHHRGIPVFFCAWLRDTISGYVDQFSRFGIGLSLQSVNQLQEVPGYLDGTHEIDLTARIGLPEGTPELARSTVHA